MPYALSKMYDPAKIATDENETFAVLVFKSVFEVNRRMKCEERMLIFTEKDGFVEVEDYKNLFKGEDVPYDFDFIVSLM